MCIRSKWLHPSPQLHTSDRYPSYSLRKYTEIHKKRKILLQRLSKAWNDTSYFQSHFTTPLPPGLLPFAGQAGVPHPQAPNCPKARLYKVLKEITENINSGSRGETALSVGGRVRSAEMKALIAKQLGQCINNLEGAAQVDLKTGRINSKKPKKEKTQSQLALDEVKKLVTKFHECIRVV